MEKKQTVQEYNTGRATGTKEAETERRLVALANHYCNPASETFNRFNASMLKAGYKKSYITRFASILRNKPSFIEVKRRATQELQHKTALTIEFIQSEHQRLQSAAEDKGDLATATRNLENLGKTIAAYEDKVQHTDGGLSLNFNSEKTEVPVTEEVADVKTIKIA